MVEGASPAHWAMSAEANRRDKLCTITPDIKYGGYQAVNDRLNKSKLGKINNREQMMAKFTQTVRTALIVTMVGGLAACGETEVAPPPPPPPKPTNFTVGGSVSGLPGSGLVLQLNGATDLEVSSNGNFNFPKPLAKGSAYAVTVKSSPSSPVKQTCTVNQGSGTVAGAPVNNIAVTCITSTFAVGGTVSGLSGKGLVLQLNGANDLAVEKNGKYIFPDVRLPDGSDYSVAIKATPARHTCKIEPVSAAFDKDTLNIAAVTCTKKGAHSLRRNAGA